MWSLKYVLLAHTEALEPAAALMRVLQSAGSKHSCRPMIEPLLVQSAREVTSACITARCTLAVLQQPAKGKPSAHPWPTTSRCSMQAQVYTLWSRAVCYKVEHVLRQRVTAHQVLTN